MIDLIKPSAGIVKAGAFVAVVVGLFGAGYHFGAQGVRAKWDQERAATATAAIRAVDQRIAENEIEREANIENNRLIQKAHDAELDRVRTAINSAPRLRSGAGICGLSAGSAETGGAGGGIGADTGGRLVREDVGRDLDALMLRVEEALAAGRACQAFVRDNGLAP